MSTSSSPNNDLEGGSPEFQRARKIFDAAMVRDFSTEATEYSLESKNDYAEALELLTICAERGEGAAMYYISLYYQMGLPPCFHDEDLFFTWTRKSYESGFIASGNNLYPMYADPRSEFYNLEMAIPVKEAMKRAGCMFVPE